MRPPPTFGFNWSGDESRHVLQEDEVGSRLANDSLDVGPDPSLVFDASLLARDAEWLATESGREPMNSATPRIAIECDNIRPDRRRTNEARFHSRDQTSHDKGFPLHVHGGHEGTVGGDVKAKLGGSEA